MKASIVLTIFLNSTLSISGFAQNYSSTFLLNKDSKEPVSYATIRSGSVVLFSDAEGIFNHKDLIGKKLEITRLGYSALTIDLLQNTDTIFLKSSAITLPALEIRTNESKKIIGLHKDKTSGATEGKIQNDLALVFKNLPETCYISNIFVATKGNRKGDVYQISLFSVGASGYPDKLLYMQEYCSPTGKDLLVIPLKKNILLEKGSIAVGFHWEADTFEIQKGRDYSSLKLTSSLKENRSFFLYKNRWFDLSSGTPGTYLNYKIGVEYITYGQ